MQNEAKINGSHKNNRILENGLLAVGLALFLMLGMRGLDKINDKAVAAGEANRNVQVSSDIGLDSFMVPSAQTLNVSDLQSAAGVGQKTTNDDSKRSENNSETDASKSKSELLETASSSSRTSHADVKNDKPTE